jgi:ATP-dependent Clp protease ATP-binding subunit ClpA
MPHPEWTGLARRVADHAGQEAASRGHQHVRSEHYLFALLDVEQTGGVLPVLVLKALDVPVDQVRQRLHGALRGRLPEGSDLPAVLRAARAEAELIGSDYLGAEQLLLGVAMAGTGVLAEFGATPDRLREGVYQVLRSYGSEPPELDPARLVREIGHLRAEVERLTGLLRSHGIEP